MIEIYDFYYYYFYTQETKLFRRVTGRKAIIFHILKTPTLCSLETFFVRFRLTRGESFLTTKIFIINVSPSCV